MPEKTEIRIDNNPDKKISKFKEKIKRNPWMLVSIILGIAIIILLYTNFSGGIGGNVLSKGDIAIMAVDFVNTALLQGQTTSILKSVEVESGIYKVVVSIGGQDAPIYFTKDGKFISTGAELVSITGNVVSDTSNQQPSAEIPKSDKPILEAIVTPYCPHGLQYMKGLLPVYELMKDKADILILSLGITHMQSEELETKRQICINQEYNKDMMFDYIKELIYNQGSETCYAGYHSGEHNGDASYFDECMTPVISSIMEKLSINEDTINNCIKKDGEKLYNDAVNYARSKGAGGSPSPFLNNVKLSAGRSPEAIKTALCSAFNNMPEECSIILSEETPAPGITIGTSSSSSIGQC